MPHVRLEYSRALDRAFDPRSLALRVNRAIADEAGAAFEDCKARLVPLDDVAIGDGGGGEFAHIEIAILSGRSEEQKRRLADAAFAALRDALSGADGADVQLSVEIRDMDRASYRKERVAAG